MYYKEFFIFVMTYNPKRHSEMMYFNEHTYTTERAWRNFNISIAVVIAIGFGFLLLSSSSVDDYFAPTEIIQAAEVLQEHEELSSELPVRLVIPSIDVDAEVQYVGLASDDTGVMDVPSNYTDVGWYKHGVRPGMRGSAVIAGHFNGKETPQAVFYDLDMMQVGDEVIVMSTEGIEDVFKVVKIATYDHDAPTADVFVSTDGEVRLNLITCGGEWISGEQTYDKRTVVFTELVTDTKRSSLR